MTFFPLFLLVLTLAGLSPARAANQAIIADGTLRLLRFSSTNQPANMTAGLAWEVRKPDGTVLDSGTAYGAGAAGKATYEGWSGYAYADPEWGNTATLSVAAGTPIGTGYELRVQGAFYGTSSNTALSTFFDVGTSAASVLKPYAIVTMGDSISAGYGATDATHTYGRQLLGLLGGFAGNYDYLNVGEFGVRVAAAAAEDVSGIHTWALNYPAANVTILVECGTNDIAGGETNDATIYNNLVTFATHCAATAPGCKLAVRTLLPRQISGGDAADTARKAVFDAVNVRIRGKVGMPAGTIILDDAALSQFAYPPLTAFIGDGTHPNNAGYAVMAQNSTQAFATSPPSAPALASGSIPLSVSWGPLPTASAAFRLYRDSGGSPVYDGPLSVFTDSVVPGSTHAYAVSAYNGAGESAKTLLTAASTGGGSTAPLTLTAAAGVNSEVLTWTADSGATNGYEVDWKPSSVLPVAGQVKSIVAIVGAGVLTWTDTSAYRLAQSGRYNVVGLH